MSAKELIDFYTKCSAAPTPLSSVRDQIKSIYDIDGILFIPFAEAEIDLLGMLVRWKQLGLYSLPTKHCAVCFNENADPWLQRLICCKEMINIFDDPIGITKTRDDVNGLLDGLFGLNPKAFGNDFVLTNVFHAQTYFDERALGQAMVVLYPPDYLEDKREDIAKELSSVAKIAAELRVPDEIAEYLLSESWKQSARNIIASSR